MNQTILIAVLVGLAAISGIVNGRSLFSSKSLTPSVEVLAEEVGSAPQEARRLEAANQILQSRSVSTATQAARTSMAQAIKESPSPGVRLAMIQSLAEVYDYTAMPSMLEVLEDPDPAVAGKAAAAVQHMLGLRYNAEDIADKKKLAKMARRDWQMLQSSPHLELWKKTLRQRESNPSSRSGR